MAETGVNLLGSSVTHYVAPCQFINYNIVLGPNQFLIFARSLEISTGAAIDVGPSAVVEVT
jgi:hypothetical protein